jgi:ferric-dicitrate binding protein FerR (iron transport regulator)
MMRHDEAKLWAYAARELDEDDRRLVDAHLEDCPECRETLATVQVAREALESAREAWPVLDWQATDDAVGALVERKLAAKARRPWLFRMALVAAAAALVAGVFALTGAEASEPALAMAEAWPPPMPPAGPTIRVESASGLTRLGRETSVVEGGAELSGGDVLRTSLAGKAFVHLPDESHLRIAGGTQLALTRVEPDDVALTLERGRLAVRASHTPRRGFVVHTGGMTVHVVGTVFAVSNSGDAMEVAVAEGKVKVELPDGDALLVGAGQRLRIDARSEKPQRLELTQSLKRELSELTEVADAAAAIEKQVVVAAVGGKPSPPPLVAAKGAARGLPRLSAEEARRRQVTVPDLRTSTGAGPGEETSGPSTERIEPKSAAVVEGPGDAWPSMASGTPEKVAPEPEPASQPAEWAAMPEPKADEWEPMPAPKAEEWSPLPGGRSVPAPVVTEAPGKLGKQSLAPKDLETLFLQRAEASLETGDCERYLLGLEDIAQDTERNARSEQARVLRARCFAAQLRPRQAMNEYRKYLSEYPLGRFREEAHEALGDD